MIVGVLCVALVLAMAFVGVYQMGRDRGVMVGACAVVKTMRADLDWSKECGGRK